MSPDTPAAPGGRPDVDGDWTARQLFTPDDLRLDPEEYVARHAHLIGVFSLHTHRFADPELGAWVRRVGELLTSEDDVERCRERYLAPEEMAAVRRAGAEDL